MAKKTGRPSKLTDEVSERLCEYMREGAYFTAACAMCRIPRSTATTWISVGRTDFEAGKSSRYADFYGDLRQAEAEAQHKALRIILAAASGNERVDSRAAVEFLKRRNATDWGTQTTVKIDAQKSLEATLSAVAEHMSDEAYDELRAAVAAVRATGRDMVGSAEGQARTVH